MRISDEELQELYEKASLTVVPSRYEAFSYVALDSLFLGTPVLLSDRVRIADFLQEVSGVTVYEYEKSNDLVQKIDEAMNKTVDVEKVKDIFSAEKAFERYSNVYNTTILRGNL